eukprot:s3928_g7.t1
MEYPADEMSPLEGATEWLSFWNTEMWNQLYTLASDLAGPFKVAGRDMDFDDCKYIMVAAYRCPEEYVDTKSHEEMVKEFEMDDYEPSEGEDGDDLMVVDKEDGDAVHVEPETDEEKGEPMGPATLDEQWKN